MLTARLEQPALASDSPLVLCSVPDPVPAIDELLLRVRTCAVCRTDLQICEGDLKVHRLPIVPGHQVVGIVEAVGSAVDGWRVGDRAAAAWLGGSCGSCARCRGGDENLCDDAEFTGWDRDGGFAELVTVRAAFTLPVLDSFSDLEAAPLLCGGVIGYRALRRSGITPGGRLGLYGFGASARLAIQVARHWDCEVFVCTRSLIQREKALSLGAAWVGTYDEQPPVPLDAAVTFAPAGSVVVAALRALDRGGTVAINAIHLDRMPEFPYELFWWERNLRSVANFTRKDAQEFLALAAEIPIRTEITGYPLKAANRALVELARGEVQGAAVLEIS